MLRFLGFAQFQFCPVQLVLGAAHADRADGRVDELAVGQFFWRGGNGGFGVHTSPLPLQARQGVVLLQALDGLTVGKDKIGDLCGGSQRPGAGIQQVQRGNRVEVGEDRVDPRHAEYAGPQNNDNGGADGPAQPAGGGNRAVHESRDAVGPAHD